MWQALLEVLGYSIRQNKVLSFLHLVKAVNKPTSRQIRTRADSEPRGEKAQSEDKEVLRRGRVLLPVRPSESLFRAAAWGPHTAREVPVNSSWRLASRNLRTGECREASRGDT